MCQTYRVYYSYDPHTTPLYKDTQDMSIVIDDLEACEDYRFQIQTYSPYMSSLSDSVYLPTDKGHLKGKPVWGWELGFFCFR